MALTLLEPIVVNTAASFTFANVSTTANLTAGNVKTDNLLYANGSPYVFTTNAAGSNTQVQFNNAGSFGASGNLTFNIATNTLSVTNLTITSNANLGNLTTSNYYSGVLVTGAQPNITSTGMLSSLTVGPNSSIILSGTTGYLKANTIQGIDGTTGIILYNGNAAGAIGVVTNLAVGTSGTGNLTVNGNITSTNASLGNLTTSNYFAGVLTTAAQPNITSTGTLSNLTVTGNISSGNANLGNLATANYFTGTLTTAAQPNITSLGTLSGLASNGTVNFTSAGNVSLGAIGNVKITGGSSGQVLSTDGSGNLSFVSVSTSSISNGNSNVSIPSANGNVTISSVGNANIVIVTGTGVNVSGTLNATGNITSINASLGNLTTSNYFSGTLTTGTQSNITTVGTLTGLTSNGVVNFTNASNVSLGAVGNVKVTGGTSGQYLQTDGTGNLSWSTVLAGGSNISNGTSNVNIPVTNGNVTVSVNSVSNVVVFDENGFTVSGSTGNITGANYVIANYFSGDGSLLSSLTGANVTGQVSNALIAGTVYTNAQPNITSVGTLTALNVSGVSTFYTAQDRFSALTGATGIVTHNMSNGAVFYHTSPSANFTPNFTNVPTTNNFITVAVIFVQQGATPYMPTATTNVQIDGSNVTVKWINSLAPTGAASAINMISYSLIRNSGVWSVLGQGASFA